MPMQKMFMLIIPKPLSIFLYENLNIFVIRKLLKLDIYLTFFNH